MSTRTPLLDVNVLVALAWPNHVHHAAAHRWFRGLDAWATCPVTQSGFVRVSSNQRAIPDAHLPSQARSLLRRMEAVRGHEFWHDTVSLTEPSHVLDRVVTHRQVTDAHLLAIALSNSGSLATFDKGVVGLVPPGVEAEAVVLLVP